MGVLTSRLWLPPRVRDELGQVEPSPDLGPFVRANLALAAGGRVTQALEGWIVSRISSARDPRLVPLASLQAMGSHPVVYLAERTISGIMRRPDLYYVRHPDKRVVRETEAWLWPLLPAFLAASARAFAYGSVPVIFDWGREDLRIEIPREAGGTRNKTLVGHTHYVAAHEVWPGDVEVEVDGDALVAVLHGGRRYAADRACVLRWDPEFGSWTGQGARRRAWQDYCQSLAISLLQARYLERSVDSPRVAWAPPGTQRVGGEELSTIDHVSQLLIALQGSGVLTFPSTRDANGNKRYELDTLEVPDRKDVWNQALNRYDGGILKAYLVPPSLTGIEDLAAAGAKILDGMLREFIQDLAQFAADQLTAIVRVVHAVNREPAKVPPPEILAYEVPAAIRKLYLEVLRLVGAANTAEPAAAWVDVPALLDQLGVPLRTAPLPVERSPGQDGRPRDVTSDREARREDARTPDGEDAVGAPDESPEEG